MHKLIEAIGTSVTNAQQEIEQHSINRFFKYYFKYRGEEAESSTNDTETASDGFEPVTAKVVMPCFDDIEKTAPVEIPLVALAHHRQVHLNKVTVKVKTQLTSDSSGAIMADINAPVFNTASFPEETEAASNNNVSELELVFNVTDSAEGMSRMVQNISKII